MDSVLMRLLFIFLTSLSSIGFTQAEDNCRAAADVAGASVTIRLYPEAGGLELSLATDCAKNLVHADPSIRHIRLELSPGVYRLAEALNFSGSWVAERSIEIEGTGTGVVISGAVSVINSNRLIGQRNGVAMYSVDAPPTLVDEMLGRWLPEHGQRSHLAPPELIVDDELQQVARWPDEGFISTRKLGSSIVFDAPTQLPDLHRSSVFGHGYWYYDWADARVELSVQALERGLIEFKIKEPKYGLREGARFYLYGAPQFLTSSGEYIADGNIDSIVFLTNLNPKSVELTKARNLLIVRGTARTRVSGVTFTAARGNAIDVVGNDTLIENSEVRNVGAVGIRMEGSNNRIERSRIAYTGYSGVEIAGGDRNTLQGSNSSITESTVEHFGRLIGSSVPGIRIEGVGISIVRNIIRHGPHAGIFFFGNDHFIVGNEVHDVAKATGDVGAIYTGRDWMGRGHNVLKNYVHNVFGVGKLGAVAFYIDDQGSGVHLKDNVAWRVKTGVLIGGGRDNKVTGNIFLTTDKAFELDARGTTWQRAATEPGGILWERFYNARINRPIYMEKYPELSSIDGDSAGLPVGNIISNNVYTGRLRIDKVFNENSEVKDNSIFSVDELLSSGFSFEKRKASFSDIYSYFKSYKK